MRKKNLLFVTIVISALTFISVNAAAWPASWGFPPEPAAVSLDKVKITVQVVEQSEETLRFDGTADSKSFVTFKFSNGTPYDNDLDSRVPLLIKPELILGIEGSDDGNHVWETLRETGAISVALSTSALTVSEESFHEDMDMYVVLDPGASAVLTVRLLLNASEYAAFVEKYGAGWLRHFENGAETIVFPYSVTARVNARAVPYDKDAALSFYGLSES
ncbi:MAG: hypothetical protein LBS84_07345 [Clostridiales bacterium]|jgi:hypothetical protein|nr:hypothetical protein [Clostridiales bacterium]